MQGRICSNTTTTLHLSTHKVLLTAVSTAPGFWIRRALTTWNTSTTPSVLHISMPFTREQNTPTRLTVSLQYCIRHSSQHHKVINFTFHVQQSAYFHFSSEPHPSGRWHQWVPVDCYTDLQHSTSPLETVSAFELDQTSWKGWKYMQN